MRCVDSARGCGGSQSLAAAGVAASVGGGVAKVGDGGGGGCLQFNIAPVDENESVSRHSMPRLPSSACALPRLSNQ